MTLIACFHPNECRTLLADILISSSAPETPEIVFPTRVYLPSDELRRMELKPTAFRRKIVEITPQLLLLWAGDYNYAKRFAFLMKSCFSMTSVSRASIFDFVTHNYDTSVSNFWALIVPYGTDWFYALGNIKQSRSNFAGQYAVAGNGAELFERVVTMMSPRDDSTIAPHVGLSVANELLAYEINTVETVRSQFGCGYEVIYQGNLGFEKVDDVIHFFTLVKRTSPTNLTLFHYSHATRQWYDQDRLCIASLATPVGVDQGLSYYGFVVPSLLDDEQLQPSYVHAEYFAQRPSHMCIHHIFEYEGKGIASTLTLSGEKIDEYYTLERDDTQVHFHPTSSYVEILHRQWDTILA